MPDERETELHIRPVTNGWYIQDAHGNVIAHVRGTHLSGGEAETYARLFASAPSLVAALARMRAENERLRNGIEDTLAAGEEHWDCYLSRGTMLSMLASLLTAAGGEGE